MQENLIKLDSLININEYSENLSIVEDIITGLVPEIFVSDLNVSVSPFKVDSFYSFKLVSFKRLGLDVLGTGMSFVLNPGIQNGNRSEFPITINFSWEILKYVENFDITSFDFSPQAFFNLTT